MFGRNQNDLAEIEHDEESEVYCGHITQMPNQIAAEVAELHPGFQEYYQNALKPLWRGYGHGLSKGSESPQIAIGSKRTRRESHLDVVLIWRAIP
jgi:hypothetical protein